MSNPTPSPIDDPAADAATLLLRIGLSILAMAVPVGMVLSRRALFILLPVGASLVLVAGLLLSDVPLRKRLSTAFLSTAGLCGFALLAWAALSILWSPVGPAGTEKLAKTAGTLVLVAVAIAFLPERTRTSNLNLFPLGILAAVVVTLGITVSGHGAALMQGDDSTLQRAIVTLVLMVWPALGAMAIRGRWIPAGIVVLAVMLAAMSAWSTTALAALAVGAIAFVVATGHAERVGRALGLTAAALILVGPVLPFVLALVLKPVIAMGGDRLPVLLDFRDAMEVWANLVIAEPLRLITGHGIDMATMSPLVGFLPPETPRSLLFEIWYDFGIVGAVLAAVLVRSAFGLIGRLSPTVAPFLVAEFMAILTIVFSGLETTQLWWVTMMGVVTLAFSTVVRGEYRTTRPLARLEPHIAPLPHSRLEAGANAPEANAL